MTQDHTYVACASATPEWGAWPVPEGVTLAWGARAIYQLAAKPERDRRGRLLRYVHTAEIDLVHDRQDMAGGASMAERKALAAWITGTGIPAIKTLLADGDINPGSSAIVEHASEGYKIVAGPRASHGYLYIRAWRIPGGAS